MKKQIQKTMAAILCLALCFSCFAAIGLSAATESEAEPVYNSQLNKLYEVTGVTGDNATYNNGVVTVTKESSAYFNSALPTTGAYYMSMNVRTVGQLNISFRGGNGYLNICQNNYRCVATETGWTDRDISSIATDAGAKVTIYSTDTAVKVWVNGELLVNDGYLSSANVQTTVKPGISWTYAETAVVSDIQLWTDELPAPTYNADTQKLYNLTGLYQTDNTYLGSLDSEIIVDAGKNAYIKTDENINNSYWYRMTVKSDGNINIDFYNDNTYLLINKSGYRVVNGTGCVWTDYPIAKLATGVELVFQCKDDGVKIWIDNSLVVNYAYDTTSCTPMPGIQWSNNNAVTVTDVAVWSDKIVTDEPFFDAEENREYIPAVSGDSVTYENGVISVPSGKNASLNVTLGGSAEYYMSMTLKNTGKYANIFYTTNDGYFQLQSAGYNSVGTGSGWVNNSFPLVKTGVRVTVHYVPGGNVQIWIGGESIVNASYIKDGYVAPAVYSGDTTAEVSDLHIWTDEPIFSAGKDSVYTYTHTGTVQEDGAITFDGTEAAYQGQPFGTTLDYDAEYYMSMTLSCEQAATENVIMALNLRSGADISFQTFGFQSNAANTGWHNWTDYKNFSRSNVVNGINLVIHCTLTHVTVWADGIKIIDSDFLADKDVGQALVGLVYVNNGVAKVNNFRVWTENTLGDCNKDSALGTEDLAFLRKYILGAESIQPADCDVNYDGNADVLDLVRFKKYFAGIAKLG